ncbi:phosphopantetheine-binding protein [Streptomyces sp. URMC 126]|uniref:phosphopantetheine-binding protein n=1 Tax=Streptomyces sp. URMC 126 TaxID=3423401 RepID=UPI003F1CECB7
MYDVLFNVLTSEFGLDPDTVTPRATLENLDLDSLTMAELGVILAEQAGALITDVSPNTTLEELAELLETKAARPPAAVTV